MQFQPETKLNGSDRMNYVIIKKNSVLTRMFMEKKHTRIGI